LDGDTLAQIWFGLLGVLLTGYAIIDGFDLGVGIVYLLVTRSDRERRIALQSIGPLWDGNEVWLVTFGGALFAAFPSAYATVFSGFYTAFMALLFALLFRAVSIEFRGKRPGRAWRRGFDVGFSAGSLLATLLFGVAVGNVMLGIPLDRGGDSTGGLADQLHPYALGVGLLTTALFAMHGVIYLRLRTEGELEERLRDWAWRCFGIFLVLFMGVTIFTLAAVPRATANLDRYPLLWAVPVLNVLAVANIPRALYRGRPAQAFLSSAAVIAALVFLLGVTLYPNLVTSRPHPEHSLTIFNAASSRGTLAIMLLIAAIGMPLVGIYTGIVYWTFRGKVRLDEAGY
jgi:cytochrome d ubiquinol oxidase subunit II